MKKVKRYKEYYKLHKRDIVPSISEQLIEKLKRSWKLLWYGTFEKR